MAGLLYLFGGFLAAVFFLFLLVFLPFLGVVVAGFILVALLAMGAAVLTASQVRARRGGGRVT